MLRSSLLACFAGCSLCAGFYVHQIKAAPSAASASAFAAPFLLCATGAAASASLAFVAIAEKRRLS
jgi:hypothetical protein